MASIYSSKLGSMKHVVSLLSDKQDSMASLDTEDNTVGAVLLALHKAFVVYTAFEYTDEQTSEKAKLQAEKAKLQALDINAVVLSEVLAAKDQTKALAIMATIPDRQAAHDTSLAAIDTKLSELAQAAQAAAEHAFADSMTTSGKSANSGERAEQIDYPHEGIVVQFPYNRNKKSVIGVFHSEENWRLYTAKDGMGKTIGYNSQDHDDSPSVKSLSQGRKIADCFRNNIDFTVDNLKKQTLGVGTAIVATPPGSKGGSYAKIISTDPAAWEKENAAKAPKAPKAEK